MAEDKPLSKKAWAQPIMFRPKERDKEMLDWLVGKFRDTRTAVIRRAIERLYELERRKASR